MQATIPTMALFAILASVRGVSAQSGPQHPSNYDTIVTAHAAISCVAWVIFFPLGAVITRYLTSPRTWLIHASIMAFSYAMFIASAGLGIWMAVVTQQLDNYHPIIGLILLALVSFQPIGGLLHHYLFREHKKSEIIAMYHIWMGRLLITLGMINGGLGLLLSGNATRSEQIAYGAIAGVIWVSWIVIVIAIPVKRGEEIPGTINQKKRSSIESDRTAVDTSPESQTEKGQRQRNGITVNFRQ